MSRTPAGRHANQNANQNVNPYTNRDAGQSTGSFSLDDDFFSQEPATGNPRNLNTQPNLGSQPNFNNQPNFGTAVPVYPANTNGVVRVRKKRKKHHYVRNTVLVVLLLLLIGVGVVGFFGYQSATSLKSQASGVMSDIDTVQSAIAANDYAAAQAAASNVDKAATSMKQELDSPLWNVAEALPVAGQEVKSVKAVVDTLQDASANALVPLTATLAATPPSSMVSGDGVIDVAAAQQLLGSLQTAAPTLQSCTDTLEALPTSQVSQLETLFEKSRTKIAGINTAFQQASVIAPILGDLLGVNGDRNYLVVAQNSAEIRPLGGFPGSIGTLNINNGAINLGSFGTPYDLLSSTMPESIQVTAEEETIFGAGFLVPRDSGLDPDYPRVAEIWSAAYTEKTDEQVNGVLSLTPAVIQQILAISGGITLSDGTQLDGSNATTVLEHDLYWKYLSGDNISSYSNELVDGLFAEAADLSFKQLMSSLNSATLMKFADVMSEGMADRTVMLWMTDAGEQASIAKLGPSGALNANPEQPQIGVYFGNWNASKMGWYMDSAVTVVDQGLVDGSQTYQVQVILSNAINTSEVSQAGDYIAGAPYENLSSGFIVGKVYLFAPAGGTIGNVSLSNGAAFSAGTLNGLPLQFGEARIAPGDEVTLTYTVTTAPGVTAQPTVDTTPTLTAYRTNG